MTQTATDLLITMLRDLTIKVDLIHTQTIKTNGRVTKLEDFVAEQLKLNSRLEGLYTASQEHTRIAIENMTSREIDEFKKKEEDAMNIKKISTEYSGKAKLAIIGGIFTILSTLIGMVSYKIGIENTDLSNVANIYNK